MDRPPCLGLLGLEVLYETRLRGCTGCGLAKLRRDVVVGCGGTERPLLAFLGDRPSAVDERQGVAFQGEEGQLLRRAVEALALQPWDVYYTNLLCCRTPRGRSPQADEVYACSGNLAAQLKLVAPRVIVCLGEAAAQGLLRTEGTLAQLRGRWHRWDDVPVRVTAHPRGVVSDAGKKKFWHDLTTATQKAQRAVSEVPELAVRSPILGHASD